jgi:hypothetical protein
MARIHGQELNMDLVHIEAPFLYNNRERLYEVTEWVNAGYFYLEQYASSRYNAS